jgi:hypothetical protein
VHVFGGVPINDTSYSTIFCTFSVMLLILAMGKLIFKNLPSEPTLKQKAITRRKSIALLVITPLGCNWLYPKVKTHGEQIVNCNLI